MVAFLNGYQQRAHVAIAVEALETVRQFPRYSLVSLEFREQADVVFLHQITELSQTTLFSQSE